MAKTIEEIRAEMRSIEAVAADEANELTNEEESRYEKLAAKLAKAQKREEILKRGIAYDTPNLSTVVHTGTAKQDDGLERAFDAFLRTGTPNQDIAELRSQTTSPSSAGGYVVPQTWGNDIVVALKAYGGIANVAREMTTENGQTYHIPTVDDTSNVGYVLPEATAPSSGGADLVFGEKTLGAWTYSTSGNGNAPIKISNQLLQDAGYDIRGELVQAMVDRVGRKQALDLVSGTGTNMPFGVTTNANTVSFSTTSGTQSISYADLVNAVHQVDPAYRDNCVWVFNDYTLQQIETLTDGQGRPLLNSMIDGISVGRANQMLLGYPIQIDQGFANFSDPSTDLFGVFGNLNKGYLIRRVQEITLMVNPYSSQSTNQTEYNMFARMDATVRDPRAYRVLKNVTP